MKALIMAGGKGARLHPYSATIPKPLMPIGDRPVLEILLEQLKNAGVNHVILAVNHLRHLIEAYFGNGSRFGITICYSFETEPLGTAGPIGQVINQLGKTFIVSNGDLLTTINMQKMIREHRNNNANVTIGAYRRELKSDFGILEVDNNSCMIAYKEKPAYSHLVSMGLYVVESEAVRPHVSENTPLDMPDLLRVVNKMSGKVYCFEDKCFWLDIGRPDDFASAQRIYGERPDFFTEG